MVPNQIREKHTTCQSLFNGKQEVEVSWAVFAGWARMIDRFD
jgi:hypothetical protein